ncbi:DUF3017 domain-containing protein [Streptomyces tsukubensis]|uniref:DUF3017 domain-containing protein n=1 Tax=Streptomyces tsukubensis TaxID=83656 RepID=UPI00267D96B4
MAVERNDNGGTGARGPEAAKAPEAAAKAPAAAADDSDRPAGHDAGPRPAAAADDSRPSGDGDTRPAEDGTEPDAVPRSDADTRPAEDGTEPDAVPRSDGAAEPDGAADPSGATVDPDAGLPETVEVVSAPGPDGRPMRATRRFSMLTRDTARPEGGGRAAGADAPAPARQWPILSVLSATGLGLLLTAFGLFRVGTMLIGVALIAGAAMRWVMPSVGMLAVRSRFTDLLTYGVLGVVIVLLAMMVQPDPLLVIPFVQDTLHFTIK